VWAWHQAGLTGAAIGGPGSEDLKRAAGAMPPTGSLCSPSVHRAAIATHARRLEQMPNGVTNYNSIAYHHVLLREYSLAANAFSAALKVDPDYQVARANLNFLRQRLAAGCDVACEQGLHAAFDGGIIDAAKGISLPFFAEFRNPIYDAFEYIYSEEPDEPHQPQQQRR